MPIDIYAGGSGPWISVIQGIIWTDDILLETRRHLGVSSASLQLHSPHGHRNQES